MWRCSVSQNTCAAAHVRISCLHSRCLHFRSQPRDRPSRWGRSDGHSQSVTTCSGLRPHRSTAAACTMPARHLLVLWPWMWNCCVWLHLAAAGTAREDPTCASATQPLGKRSYPAQRNFGRQGEPYRQWFGKLACKNLTPTTPFSTILENPNKVP